jgi:spermidine/putrescine transport system ATP-binding protein
MPTANDTSLTAIELVDVCKSFDTAHQSSGLVVDHLSLKIKPGEFFTFLGPSGCGKTTTLRMIAGFERPTSGQILIAGQDMSRLPAYQRPVNTVFQSYALFPHLSIEDNVGFGLDVKRVPKPERQDRVKKALELVRMGGAANRKPSALSGGQQQRIALARALVNEPSVLLLDEPFGALDLKLRRDMQFELKQMQRRLGITFVFVTHDQEEALTMSDRIAVMNAGVVHQVDDPTGIYERPIDTFTASFIGDMNMFAARVVSQSARGLKVETMGGQHMLPRSTSATKANVTLAVRPEAMKLHATPNVHEMAFSGQIVDVIYIGADRRYLVKLSTGETAVVRVQNAVGRDTQMPKVGSQVKVSCPLSAVRLLDS